MAVPPPADRRFRRKHVKPGRRASRRLSWRTLAVVVASASLAIVLAGVLVRAAITSRWLSVARISLEGNAQVARGEVDALLGDLIGRSMLTLDLDAWRQNLRDLPWVKDVAIRRVFPNTLVVAVSERTAVGIGRFGEQLCLVDLSGEIIEEYGPNHAGLDLPIINGLAAAGAAAPETDRRTSKVLARFFEELRRHPDLAHRVSEIDVTDPGNVALVLNGDAVSVHVGDDHFAERLQMYLDIRSRLRETAGDLEYVDVRYLPNVYLMPAERERSS